MDTKVTNPREWLGLKGYVVVLYYTFVAASVSLFIKFSVNILGRFVAFLKYMVFLNFYIFKKDSDVY